MRDAERRLLDEGVATTAETGACCYAEQDKVWTLTREIALDLGDDTHQSITDIDEKIGNLRGQAMTFNSIGGVYRRQKRYRIQHWRRPFLDST